jgi:hypothetical protein
MVSYLRHHLQPLALTNILALAHSILQLLNNLLVQRLRARDDEFHLTPRGAHQSTELLHHALQHAQAVVLGQRRQEVLQGVVLVLDVGALLQLGDDLLLVRLGEGGRAEDALQAGVALEGVAQVLEGAGDGVEGTLLGGGGVLCVVILVM